LGNIFSTDEDAGIASHFLRERFADRLSQSQFTSFRHKYLDPPHRESGTERRSQKRPLSELPLPLRRESVPMRPDQRPFPPSASRLRSLQDHARSSTSTLPV